MIEELSNQFKNSFKVRVLYKKDGWVLVPCSVKNGEVFIDITGIDLSAVFHLEVNFTERFRQIGSGFVLIDSKWVAFSHEEGLDTKWNTTFNGGSLINAIKYVLRDGNAIEIKVNYIGLPGKEEAEEIGLKVLVRTDRQMANFLWKCDIQNVKNYGLVVKAVEFEEEYTVISQAFPASVSFFALDKLAAGKYNVQVFALDENKKELIRSEKSHFIVTRD